MRKRDSRNKQSNKGFTLVEVLVAILILSIIVVPLLTAFVVSARTNSKARQTLRATTLAQNVMEELKAHSLEETILQYNGHAGTNAMVGMAQKSYETLLHADGVHKVLVVDAQGQLQGDALGNALSRAEGRYDFVLQGVTQGSAKFDVEIMLRKPELKDPAQLAGVGQLDMVNIISMNRNDCGYYAQQEEEHSLIAAEFAVRRQNYVGTGDISAAEFEDWMTRTITIDVARIGGLNDTVKVTYDYQIPGGYLTEADRHHRQQITVFDGYVNGTDLQSVYIYYYPLYGIQQRDTFVINNPDDLDVNVYLIKMKDTAYNSYDDINYMPLVSLYETEARSDNNSHAKICTNILESKLNKYYNGSGANLRVGDLGNAEPIQNLYDVTIRVYKHDSGAFTNVDGNTLIEFDDSDRIATFTGTMLDKAE